MDRENKVVSVPRFGLLLLGAVALAAGAANRATADEAAPAGGRPDDAEIVQRLLSMNRVEERIADTVKGRVSSPSVWQLAHRMSVDHALLDRNFGDLPSPRQRTSVSGTADVAVDLGDLSNLSGYELEKAYVDHEVKLHETMLAAIDRQLIPNAKSDELRRRLIDLRTEVAAHLQNAQTVQREQASRAEYLRRRDPVWIGP